MKTRILHYLSVNILLSAAISSARAQVDPQGPVSLDPYGTYYSLPSPIDFPSANVEIQNLELAPVTQDSLPTPGTGSGSFPATSFFDIFTNISLDGGHTFNPFTGTATLDGSANLPSSSSPSETFNDSLTELHISATDPAGTGVIVDLNPADLASDTGQTTVTETGGGHYNISSFFDIFTEISLDGGSTFTPQSGSSQLDIQAPDNGTTLPLLLCAVGMLALAGRCGAFKNAWII